ncbi:hypothetical protein [Sinorhizobium medicae]|uniref:hypothetical protein n=1 Tax=Sinorhizobium medicae TaxID=110321 RepID=UPI0011A78443|nr:hypothetical protein [Sinorhizobium medicae]
MSQSSRLVFAIPTGASWTPRLRIDELTNWSRLIPIVHERADVGVSIEAQLHAAFPDHTPADLAGLSFAKAQELLVAQLEGPDEGETALEMAGRLIFSPSSAGRWILPDELPQNGPTPLWTARLDRAGRSSVKALWSSRLEPHRLPINLDLQEPAGEAMLSLDRQNHWDIVLQSSMYGWPALRSLPPEPTASALTIETAHDTVEVPRPTVVRPDIAVGFLNEIDTKQTYANQDSGIAIARPFEDGDISVSALGGLTALAWSGDPPSIFWTADGDPLGVLLERLFYRGYLGRDTEVVAVEKGYLFPLGIRASLLTVHERAVYPDYAGNPVSYLIRRRFIVMPRKPRTYPGPYQPFAGREFPPREVKLETLVTPDLAELVNVPLRLPPESEPLPAESIFWPQTVQANAVSDLLFEWSTEDASCVRSNFIFVLNNVVNRQDAMRALVAYYNAEDDYRRTAWLGGARHRYADPRREGDTSFDTTRWLLSAQGRRDGLNGEEHFARDGRMEGANQPPFYPVMERGFVSMQSIEQMLGIPHGQVEVRYFDGYKREGIETNHEIFLTLGQDALALRASNKSERSGGIASPDLNVAAISRLTGPVGGKKNPALTSSELDFGKAAAGTFDPSEFFGDAKLLGVVKLADIVKVATASVSLNQAPQLLDETLFGARAELELVQQVASDLRLALYGADGRSGLVARLETGIAKADSVLAGANLSLADVYPSLTEAMAPLRGQPADIKGSLDAVISARTAEEVRLPIATLVPEVRTLLDAIADVVKDPVPDAFEEIITTVRNIFETLFKGAEEQARNIAANAYQLLLEWLKASFCEAIDGDHFGSILFGDRGTLSCTEIFADPAAALKAISDDGFYGAVFDQAWLSLAEILAVEADLRVRLDLELDQRRDEINLPLRAGVGLIADRLEAFDPTREDLRDQRIQDRFFDAVLGDLTAHLRPPSATMTPEEALEFASSVRRQFPGQAQEAIDNRLAELLPTIWPIANVEREALLDELSELVRQTLIERLIDPLLKQVVDLIFRLTRVVGSAARSGYDRILKAVTALFDAIIQSGAIAELARAGRAIQAVCDAVGDAAKVIGDGVMEANADLETAAQGILDAAARIQIPRDPLGRPLREALASLTSAAEQALVITGKVELERQKLVDVAGTICDATRDYLDPVAAIIRLRESVTEILAEIARQCEKIDTIFASGRPSASDRAALKEATEQCATLAGAITGINKLRQPSQTLDAAVTSIHQAGLGTAEYRDRLVRLVGRVRIRAAALHGELSQVIAPGRLLELLEEDVRQFRSDLDRNLAAFLLQSVGLPPSALAAIEEALVEALAPFVGYLLPIYDAVESILQTILDNSPTDPILSEVYTLALGGAKIQALQEARVSLGEEKTGVEAIARNPDFGQVNTLVESYRNGSAALPKAIEIVEALGLVDVGQALTDALREELRKIAEEVRALVLQLVPTKLQTRYFWPTQLGRFPDSDDGWIFKPTDASPPTNLPSVPPPNHPVSQPGFVWHLWIDGRFSFDIVTGQREVEIVGILRPFDLRLLGAQFHMLTIAFDETRFTSKNGGAPDFAVRVKDVTIGPYLEFVKKLQEWLCPQGSGFYLKPAGQFPGVEVGYIYDAGIIQIGTLQFINVAFKVAAILPFSKDSISDGQAKFVFALASRERPFLIASPPYGGGGWVTITCTSRQVEKLDLAFVFGGVAAIKFGPLNAQGRIVAGIRVQSGLVGDDRIHIITAIFEAVGEGSIACFSICVSIRVALVQKIEGALYGETTYRFSFKVGFVRLTYGVSARYRLSNGSDPQSLKALDQLTASGPEYIEMIVPKKETQWQAYRRHFDLELLEAA